MKYFLFLFTILISWSVNAQKKVNPTDTLRISGLVKNERVLTLADLDSFTVQTIGNITLTNHMGEAKNGIKGLKGILLKDVLEKTIFLAEKPKELSEFYFVFMASDGYKVVFSWNEIYNTATGNSLYLVMEMEGKNIKDLPERMLLVSSADFKTGRRYVKGLSRIIIKRATE